MNDVGHVFNVSYQAIHEHVENVLHEIVTASPRSESSSLGMTCLEAVSKLLY